MSDTFTANGKVRKPAQNAYPNAWATRINDDAIELLDDMIAGTQAINLGVSTTYSLADLANGADSESRAMVLSFTGTPAAAVTVTVPASVTSKLYLVENNCGQPITIKYAATSGVIVSDSARGFVRANGTSVYTVSTVTSDAIGQTLDTLKRTPLEIAANVFPVNFAYDPGQPERYGMIGAGDDGPAIRIALSTGEPVRFKKYTIYTVDYDPASAFNDSGTTRYSYSISVPSNRVLIFEAGATIQQKAGAQKWTRTVVFISVSKIRVFGELKVDGNVANVGTTTNEQMHGVFIFNASDLHIERIDSRNTRGDNVYIGGTDPSTYSVDIHIGSIRAVKAGRKNLVIGYVDALYIGSAHLDNSTGGAGIYSGGVADATDKHSLDVEPDSNDGSRRFVQTIGHLKTYGLGNDFSAGTTPNHGDNWILHVHDFDCVISGSTSSVYAWEQNAITLKIGKLAIVGINSSLDSPVKIAYAARLHVGECIITGASPNSGKLVEITASGADANIPKVTINALRIINTAISGVGVYSRSAFTSINLVDADCGGEALLYNGNVGGSQATEGVMTVNELITNDTGTASTGAVVTITRANSVLPNVTLRKITVRDSRGGIKAASIVSIASGCAAGVTIGEINNYNSIAAAVSWAGSDKFVRLMGGGGAGAVYLCHGTPESMIAAPVGSLALRDDGSTSTSLYVKTSGSANTGWTAK